MATYEITQPMWLGLKSNPEGSVNGQAHRAKLAKLQEQKQQMIIERKAGMNCVQLAEKYKMSVHMARYYTQRKRKCNVIAA